MNRLFISDRAHLVFDFHQIVDGLKEVELGGSRQVSCFTISDLSQIPSVIALEPRKKVSVPPTPERPLDPDFVYTTSSITKLLLRSSAK